jgi:hypothetical protein
VLVEVAEEVAPALVGLVSKVNFASILSLLRSFSVLGMLSYLI